MKLLVFLSFNLICIIQNKNYLNPKITIYVNNLLLIIKIYEKRLHCLNTR